MEYEEKKWLLSNRNELGDDAKKDDSQKASKLNR